jgi:hypothetical protein
MDAVLEDLCMGASKLHTAIIIAQLWCNMREVSFVQGS